MNNFTKTFVFIILLAFLPIYCNAQEITPVPEMSLSIRAEIFWAHQKEIYEALDLTEGQLQAIEEIINEQRAVCQPVLDDLKAQLSAGTISLEDYQTQMKIRLSGQRELTLEKIEGIFTEEQANMYPFVLQSLNK